MRYMAETVVFLVYPATFVAMSERRTTKEVADAWVR
jgi:hypothetical protein